MSPELYIFKGFNEFFPVSELPAQLEIDVVLVGASRAFPLHRRFGVLYQLRSYEKQPADPVLYLDLPGRRYRKALPVLHVESLGEVFTHGDHRLLLIHPVRRAILQPLGFELYRYPLHLGVTEAGPRGTAGIRSAVAMAILLNDNIGDTIRVSISGSPEPEPLAGWEILSSLDMRHRFVRIVSCPTCARTRLDVETLALKVQKMVQGLQLPLTVAVMGCEVNGPGEARDADIAVIGTPAGLLLWRNGESLGTIPENELEERLIEELNNLERRIVK